MAAFRSGSGVSLPLGNVGGGKYDGAFMSILQDCVKLPVFLENVFSFLARKTDLFILMKPDDTTAKMGFPPGEAEDMVHQAFMKYEILTRKREADILEQEAKQKLKEEEIIQQTDELPITIPSVPKHTYQHPSAAGPIKEATRAAEIVSDTFNGGETQKYKWSQSLTDLDVRVPVPKGTKSKDVRVEIRSDHLKVEQLRPERKVILDDPLLHKIKVDDSMWMIDNSKQCLTINVEKTKEIMWKSVFEGEEEIDITKVDTSRDISEFDPETQAAIQRASYDNRMKMLGKPTSQDKKAHDILKKAWDAEGSPFKGTPFDPSRVQMTGNWD